jgi:hypothetical protein
VSPVPGFSGWTAMECLFLFLSVWFQTPAAQQAGYQQTYTILIRGMIAGQETVEETQDREGSTISSSEHEIFLKEGSEIKRMAFVTRMVLAKGSYAPLSYSVQYTSGESRDSYDLKVAKGEIRRILNRGGHTSDISVPVKSDVLVLDFSVYHHYDYIARRYDYKKKGRQTFTNFVPLIGSEVPMALTHISDTNLDYGKGTVLVRNYKVEFMSTWTGTLSVDKNNRLVRLIVPAQDLEVLRKDLMPAQ